MGIDVCTSDVRVDSPKKLPTKVDRRRCLGNRVSVLEGPVVKGIFFQLGCVRGFKAKVVEVGRTCEGTLVGPSCRYFSGSVGMVLPIVGRGCSLGRTRRVLIGVLGKGRGVSESRVRGTTRVRGDGTMHALGDLVRGGVLGGANTNEKIECALG